MQLHSGLSTGAKAGIGIGVSLGALFLAGFGAFAFWWGKRSEKRKKKDGDEATTRMTTKAELGPGIPRRRELEDTSVPLNDEEKAELERRRRTAELEGSPVSPVELPSERAQLEALRDRANMPVEMD